MPGIIGCLSSSGTKREVQNARLALNYAPDYKDDFLFEDDHIICTRTHLNIIGEKKTPIESNEVNCWIEGEFYNIAELKQKFRLTEKTEGTILLEAYKKNILKEVLSIIDGLYSAVIYDKEQANIRFITDRFGLKPFFIWKKDTQLIWSSEIKGLLAFNQFPKKINQEGLLCFYKIGQFIGDSTWFEEVTQLSASTLLTYSIQEKEIIEKTRYWTWESIKPVNFPFEEVSEQLGILFNKAVEKRCFPQNQQYGLSLSGGLDSRAILAAIPKEFTTLRTFTFGKKNCDDIKYAKEVSKIASCNHQSFELHPDNWFQQRIEAIWKSDGHLNFIHFHASQFHKQIGKLDKIIFNGFAGDLIMGGSWMDEPDLRISNKKAAQKFPDYWQLDKPEDPFYNIDKEDPFYINTRVRRFTAYGLSEIKHFENRIPFFDNDLIELIYAIPDEYRSQNHVYHHMLLNNFYQYFEKIPRQGSDNPINKASSWNDLPKKIYKSLLNKAGFNNRQFADYDNWIIKEKHLFQNLLKSKDVIFPDYINYNEYKEGITFTNLLKTSRLITLEIWLQQVFNNRYFTTEELLASV